MANAPAQTGPVDMMLIGFSGNRFDGSVIPALRELVDNGTVRLIDLVVVSKDGEGNVTAAEVSELDDADNPFHELEGEIGELFSEDDLAFAGEQMPPDSTAALVLWENSWAANLVGAVSANGGEVLMSDRIPADVVAEALAAQPD